MKLPAHAAASAILGAAVYGVTHSRVAAAAALLSGIFIDLDHVFDYFLLSRDRFSLAHFFAWHHEVRWPKIYVVLHSIELFLVLAWLAWGLRQDAVFGIVLGVGTHLALDQIGNRRVAGYRLSRGFYFLTYRWWVGFRKERLVHPRRIFGARA